MRTIGSGALALAGLGTLAAILKDFAGMSVAVEDRARYDEGWAYISFRDPAGDLKPAAAAFPKETCFNCHAEHAATDNVFTQLYPILQRSR